jgi:segregation and condensation protein B
MAHRAVFCFEPSDAALARDPELARLEAILFVADAPISARRLAQIGEFRDAAHARKLIARLNRLYCLDNTAFRVEELAGGYSLLTRPELRAWLEPLIPARNEWQLSRPMLETLAIVAYRQPITRADVEAIRGVQVDEMLRQLLERGLIRLVGRDDSLGRPYLYGTTRKFLDVFGLRDLGDLPLAAQLRRHGASPSPKASRAASPGPAPAKVPGPGR